MRYHGLCTLNHSRKGGVARTTSVLCPGTGLSDRGKKVLLLDLDAQGSLSIAMGCDDPDRISVTMAEIFQRREDTRGTENAASGILSVSEHLDYLPANRRMAVAEQELALREHGEWILERFLEELSQNGKHYDYILLDCLCG